MSAELPDDLLLVQTRRLPTGEIDDELMALDSAAGDVLGLDVIGTQLWRLAAEPVTLAAMIDWATAHYEVARDEAAADIRTFVGDLLEAGLLERAP